MKKTFLSILGILAFAVASYAQAPADGLGDSEASLRKVTAVEGLWVRDMPNQARGMKQFTNGRVWVSYMSLKTGIVDQFMTGTYSLDGATMIEHYKFATEGWASLLNLKRPLSISISKDGSTYTQSGPGTSTETWYRADPK